MKLEFFSDVVVELQGTPAAPVLVYRVTERPTVREARIEETTRSRRTTSRTRSS